MCNLQCKTSKTSFLFDEYMLDLTCFIVHVLLGQNIFHLTLLNPNFKCGIDHFSYV